MKSFFLTANPDLISMRSIASKENRRLVQYPGVIVPWDEGGKSPEAMSEGS
jgi:hypothetical protein